METRSPISFERVAQILSRAHLQADFRTAVASIVDAGFVDADGAVAFVPAAPDELVYDLFQRASDAGDKVVFVTFEGGALRLCACTRTSGGPGSATKRMKLGTTVSEWFALLDSSRSKTTWVADHVPDSVPDYFVSTPPVATPISSGSRI